MSKNKVHLLVDLLAYLVMACLASTGLILWKILPPGSSGRHGERGLALLGMTRHEWGDIHFYLALSLLGLTVLHVALHWKWVRNTFGSLFRPRAQRKAGAGPAGSLALLVLGLVAAGIIAAPWLIPTEERPGSQGKQQRGPRAEGAIAPQLTEGHEAAPGLPRVSGRLTLAEAAEAAGVSPARLAAELGIPENTPPQSRLGRLRQEHGFTMEDVRGAVARLREKP